jgi:hypothetical protein
MREGDASTGPQDVHVSKIVDAGDKATQVETLVGER